MLEGSDGEIDIKRDLPVEQIVSDRAAMSSQSQITAAAEAIPVSHVVYPQEANTVATIVTYETLKDIVDPSNLPAGVDPSNREKALSDDEFVRVFGMDKQSFQSLPGWKRTSMKKDRGLF